MKKRPPWTSGPWTEAVLYGQFSRAYENAGPWALSAVLGGDQEMAKAWWLSAGKEMCDKIVRGSDPERVGRGGRSGNWAVAAMCAEYAVTTSFRSYMWIGSYVRSQRPGGEWYFMANEFGSLDPYWFPRSCLAGVATLAERNGDPTLSDLIIEHLRDHWSLWHLTSMGGHVATAGERSRAWPCEAADAWQVACSVHPSEVWLVAKRSEDAEDARNEEAIEYNAALRKGQRKRALDGAGAAKLRLLRGARLDLMRIPVDRDEALERVKTLRTMTAVNYAFRDGRCVASWMPRAMNGNTPGLLALVELPGGSVWVGRPNPTKERRGAGAGWARLDGGVLRCGTTGRKAGDLELAVEFDARGVEFWHLGPQGWGEGVAS